MSCKEWFQEEKESKRLILVAIRINAEAGGSLANGCLPEHALSNARKGNPLLRGCLRRPGIVGACPSTSCARLVEVVRILLAMGVLPEHVLNDARKGGWQSPVSDLA